MALKSRRELLNGFLTVGIAPVFARVESLVTKVVPKNVEPAFYVQGNKITITKPLEGDERTRFYEEMNLLADRVNWKSMKYKSV